MGKTRKPNKIKKSDYNRVLVTETLPNETPIIFSNEGFYNRVRRRSEGNAVLGSLLENLVFGESNVGGPTVPYKYKIRKNLVDFRQLSLLHPIAQWRIREFYKAYENLILHFCRRSPASIRSPEAIAGTFYSKMSWENIHQYKDNKIIEKPQDPFTRYSPSFFAYRGYDRLYKFFSSKDFLELEKHFGVLWSLDVSKCFESIYTHSLSWALKDKPFTKKHVDVLSTFGQAFDGLMKHGNHNETHGIVIGPEISRIFAEILFQSIDTRAILKLNEEELVFGSDYSIRRYVDDVYIFAKNEEVARRAYECYNDTLTGFHLYANASKRTSSKRPFMSKKSRIIQECSVAANFFCSQFLDEKTIKGCLLPTRVYDVWGFTRSFIEKIKSICSYNDVTYNELSSYLISLFTERVKKLANVNASAEMQEDLSYRYRDAVTVLIDVLYFLYTVSPTVSASYKLCTSIIVLIRFAEKHLPAHEQAIKHRIYEHTEGLLSTEEARQTSKVEGFVSLEVLNVVLAARELGDHYLLSEKTIERLFCGKNDLSYFGVISCLFYLRDNPDYGSARAKVMQSIGKLLSDLSDITRDAEKACLFLDMMGCPYINASRKRIWLKRMYAALGKPMPPDAEVNPFLAGAVGDFWFVNWRELDLLNSLERKELKRAY